MPRLLAAACLGAAACSSGPPVASGTRFEVRTKTAAFYKYGPAQSFGPDFRLKKGDPLTMLEKSFGFSRVSMVDGTTGYMSTDELQPAPPAVLPPSRVAAVGRRSGSPGESSANREVFNGPERRSDVESVPSMPLFDMSDIPLPPPDASPPPEEKPTEKSKPEITTDTVPEP